MLDKYIWHQVWWDLDELMTDGGTHPSILTKPLFYFPLAVLLKASIKKKFSVLCILTNLLSLVWCVCVCVWGWAHVCQVTCIEVRGQPWMLVLALFQTVSHHCVCPVCCSRTSRFPVWGQRLQIQGLLCQAFLWVLGQNLGCQVWLAGTFYSLSYLLKKPTFIMCANISAKFTICTRKGR